jgi:hypothetical protein
MAAAAAPVVMPHQIRLPAFIESNVKGWLTIAEMTMAAVDNQTRYAVVLRHLPSHISNELTDVVLRHSENQAPDWAVQYKEFKDLLIARNSDSDRVALNKLLSSAQRDNRKPTVFLRYLKSLIAGRAMDCDTVIRNSFFNNMPPTIRTVLMMTPDADLDVLAKIADGMLEANPQQSANLSAVIGGEQFGAAAAAAPPSAIETQLATLVSVVTALTDKVKSMEQQQNTRRTRSASKGSKGNRSGSRPAGEENPDLCWYHNRFQSQASKCQTPCIWMNKTGCMILPARNSSRPVQAIQAAQPAPIANQSVTYADLAAMLGQILHPTTAAVSGNAPTQQ